MTGTCLQDNVPDQVQAHNEPDNQGKASLQDCCLQADPTEIDNHHRKKYKLLSPRPLVNCYHHDP